MYSNIGLAVILGYLCIQVKSEATMTTDDSGIYFGAVVMFNYTDSLTGEATLGSTSFSDEVGVYGFHSPIKEVFGNVVYAYDRNTENRDGCDYDYSTNNLSQPWIALMSRGGCTFSNKIDNAYKYNASGVLIYDYENTDKTIMSHESSRLIVSVMINYDLGVSIANILLDKTNVVASIYPGGKHKTSPNYELGRTSIIFVSVSFMILMLVSLAWLVFYYIQRFRMVRALNRGERNRNSETRRALSKLPTKTLKSNDELLSGDNICAICIDSFKINDCVRTLKCKHSFHKKCVDPWLLNKQTCPMCKVNFLKTSDSEVVGHRNDIEMEESNSSSAPDSLLQNEEVAETNLASSSHIVLSHPPATTEVKV